MNAKSEPPAKAAETSKRAEKRVSDPVRLLVDCVLKSGVQKEKFAAIRAKRLKRKEKLRKAREAKEKEKAFGS